MDLRELYQQVILDHNRSPCNCREIESCDCSADGSNPLCGDKITVYLSMDGNTVRDIAFQGAGCAICMASASMMTERLKGCSRDEAESIFEEFHGMVTGVEELEKADGSADTRLGKLEVFSGVREFPVRVKCASLPWHTFRAALANNSETVTTE
jgi:nitrogen fixation NifU-like protein